MKAMQWIVMILSILLFFFRLDGGDALPCWHNRVVPDVDSSPIPLPPPSRKQTINNTSTYKKKIPQILWIGFRTSPTADNETREHILTMFKTNPNWTVYLYGNDEEHAFMEHYFANTSILWAFKHANPKIGVTYSDIFRYCALWLFGGVFIDDDASIRTPLDKMIREQDSLLLTNEKHMYRDRYAPFHHLSSYQMGRKYCPQGLQDHTIKSHHHHHHHLPSWKKNVTSSGSGSGGGSGGGSGSSVQSSASCISPQTLFSSRPLVNWLMFAAPRNEILLRALHNIVELFTAEYMSRSAVWLHGDDGKYHYVFYSTGISFESHFIHECQRTRL